MKVSEIQRSIQEFLDKNQSKNRNTKQPWNLANPEKVEVAKYLREQGYTFGGIARHFGVSITTIRCCLGADKKHNREKIKHYKQAPERIFKKIDPGISCPCYFGMGCSVHKTPTEAE